MCVHRCSYLAVVKAKHHRAEDAVVLKMITDFSAHCRRGQYYNGSEVPQGQNRQTINLAQRWVKNGLFVIGWKWPKSESKVGFGAEFVKKKAPKPTFDPLLGHFQPMMKNPFLTHLCQINCLTILALRDLRPIIRP